MSLSHQKMLIRLPNWVGDVVMSLPVLQTLKHAGFELQLIGKPWARDLLSSLDLSIISLDNSLRKSFQNITHNKQNDKILLLTNSFSSALLAWLCGLSSIGYIKDNRRILLKAGLAAPTHIQHEVEYYWNIAKFASRFWYPELTWPSSIPKMHLPVTTGSLLKMKAQLAQLNIQEPFFVLCPFATGLGKGNKCKKVWPFWREFSHHLSQQGISLLVCPSAQEEALCSQLVPEASILKGLGLADYAAIMSLATKVIANDTGPMHIAAAVGADTIGIFGVSDPNRTRPWGGRYIGSKESWPLLREVLDFI